MATFKNNVELKNLDEFYDFIKKVSKDIASQKDYHGYPKLPDNWLDVYEIFSNAPEDQKAYIFSALWGYFLKALRGWKSDIDRLWVKEKLDAHLKMYENYYEIVGEQEITDFHMLEM